MALELWLAWTGGTGGRSAREERVRGRESRAGLPERMNGDGNVVMDRLLCLQEFTDFLSKPVVGKAY